MSQSKAIEETARTLVLEGFDHDIGAPTVKTAHDPVWKAVHDAGTKLWLDTGDKEAAAALWTADFEALTTNNTLLNNEVQKGVYDGLVTEAGDRLRASAPDIDRRTLLIEIAFVLNAYHGLRLVEAFDAHVSVELHTDVADDVERSIAYAVRLYGICPERFIVKVPLTPAGFLAARKLGKLKIPVNLTLGFSARQNYCAAVLSAPRYVNVFMGRLNAFVADNGLGDGSDMGEKAAVSTQRELLDLRVEGISNTLLIGASMRAGDQISELAGLDIFTIPPKAAAEYRKSPDAEISSHIGDYHDVALAPGVGIDDFNGGTLWEVPQKFKTCVDDLAKMDVDGMGPEGIRWHFRKAGLGDFLPNWSKEDLEAIAADGKIPSYERWKQKLASKEVGLDSLMTVSGLLAFATDQKALDDRVASLL